MSEFFRQASFAEAYEADLVARVFGPWADRLLAHVSLEAGERVLDLCCGTGAVARRVVAVVGRDRVIGVDASGDMLDVARHVDAEGLVAWCQGDATAVPLADGAVDLAFCQQGLQFVSDRVGALRELTRVVRPGGRLGLAVWRPLPENPVLHAVTMADRALGWPTRMAEVGFSLGDGDELAALARAAGWSDVTVTVDELRSAVPTVEALVERRACTPSMRDSWQAASEAERGSWRAMVVEALAAYQAGEQLVAPSRANVLTATR